MKLSSKSLPVFTRILVASLAVGTLAWELVERIIALAGRTLDLAVGPIGFDVHVVALWFMLNPGTLLGILPAVLLFRRL
ncbi:MAG: hypothetical protein ACLFNT_07535 [Spirochaetales bacterium]